MWHRCWPRLSLLGRDLPGVTASAAGVWPGWRRQLAGLQPSLRQPGKIFFFLHEEPFVEGRAKQGPLKSLIHEVRPAGVALPLLCCGFLPGSVGLCPAVLAQWAGSGLGVNESSCHQPKGEGFPFSAGPLTFSVVFSGSEHLLPGRSPTPLPKKKGFAHLLS